MVSKSYHTVFRSPSAHHQSSFQRHRDLREHIRGQKGPVEWSAARRFLSIIECRKYSILNQRGKMIYKMIITQVKRQVRAPTFVLLPSAH